MHSKNPTKPDGLDLTDTIHTKAVSLLFYEIGFCWFVLLVTLDSLKNIFMEERFITFAFMKKDIIVEFKHI